MLLRRVFVIPVLVTLLLIGAPLWALAQQATPMPMSGTVIASGLTNPRDFTTEQMSAAAAQAQSRASITVPVGLNLLIYGDVFHWGQLMAASVITTVPVVALYMFIHRWMVEGLAAGSVKG